MRSISAKLLLVFVCGFFCLSLANADDPVAATATSKAPPSIPKASGEGESIYNSQCKKSIEQGYQKCVVENDSGSQAIGGALLQGGSGGAHNAAEVDKHNLRVGRDVNGIAMGICKNAYDGCRSSCQKTHADLEKKYQELLKQCQSKKGVCPDEQRKMGEVSRNQDVTESAYASCSSYFTDKYVSLGGSAAHLSSSGLQAGNVGDETRAGFKPTSNYGGPLNGGAQGEKEDEGMSPLAAGAIGAGIGGLAGYMFGKKKGEKEGYKKGKEEGEKGDDDDDDDDDDENASNSCDSEASATLPNCQESFLVKCDADPTATGCSAFTSHYCDSTGTTQPNAAFCRKQAAHNYCTQSDSVNRNNCPSCREIANNFTGQYSPEDLANSCSLCTNDPICTANGGALYAYQNQYGAAPGSNPLPRAVLPAGGAGNAGGTSANVDPSQRYSDNTSSPGRNVAGEQNGQNGVGGNGGQGGNFPGFGGNGSNSAGNGGAIFAANGQAQRVGANQAGIASSFGHSNFRIHSQVIQRSCQRGTMVGCGPLAGVQAGGGTAAAQ